MIEFKNIKKIYNNGGEETVVLKGISFRIEDGEFVAIMGPSGSGKSTLMHILGALDSPTGGDYLLDKKDVAKMSTRELAETRKNKIGFVFQAYNLLPRATVLKNVMMPLMYAGVPSAKRKEKAMESLAAAGLSEDRWNHHSNQLSGGQMQRVAIARALVNDPSIILADEPTGNLDSKTGQIVLETFQKLNEQKNCTIVLITHERYVAEHANRIIHILDGEIIQDEKNIKRRKACYENK
jgi:putative ABC transport system ATP-binding protein